MSLPEGVLAVPFGWQNTRTPRVERRRLGGLPLASQYRSLCGATFAYARRLAAETAALHWLRFNCGTAFAAAALAAETAAPHSKALPASPTFALAQRCARQLDLIR